MVAKEANAFIGNRNGVDQSERSFPLSRPLQRKSTRLVGLEKNKQVDVHLTPL